MRKTFFILIALAPPIAVASAEQTRPFKLDRPAGASSLPVKEPKADPSCSAYGAGFLKLAGTDTCVKVGGAIGVGAGGTLGR